MIWYPNCKINIGLDVLERRDDGYHNIETLMLPVAGPFDSIEIVPSEKECFSSSGLEVECAESENLCIRAYRLMRERFGAGRAAIHLHKAIPAGAGLGGGSSDAAFTIKGINSLFALGLGEAEMEELASELGSDTAFFIRNRAAICRGRGEITEPFDAARLHGKYITIIKPPFGVPTAEAYAGIVPRRPDIPICERLREDISLWRRSVKNDFEPAVFAKYPLLGEIKERLYAAGAIYASMSGSGSAMFAISEEGLGIEAQEHYLICESKYVI